MRQEAPTTNTFAPAQPVQEVLPTPVEGINQPLTIVEEEVSEPLIAEEGEQVHAVTVPIVERKAVSESSQQQQQVRANPSSTAPQYLPNLIDADLANMGRLGFSEELIQFIQSLLSVQERHRPDIDYLLGYLNDRVNDEAEIIAPEPINRIYTQESQPINTYSTYEQPAPTTTTTTSVSYAPRQPVTTYAPTTYINMKSSQVIPTTSTTTYRQPVTTYVNAAPAPVTHVSYRAANAPATMYSSVTSSTYIPRSSQVITRTSRVIPHQTIVTSTSNAPIIYKSSSGI